MNNNDVYKRITERIQQDLNNGIIPWMKPWVSLGCYSRFSYKKKSDKVHYYSFLNSMMLPKGGEWGTIHQWNSIGGTIRKGTKANWVYFGKEMHSVRETVNDDGEIDVRNCRFYLLKPYMVFHIDDVEGVEKLQYTKNVEGKLNAKDSVDTIAEAENAFNGYLEREGIALLHDKEGAFYSSTKDIINLPGIDTFVNSEEYYSTAFHEAMHSTGHETRLHRSLGNRFGSKAYAAEEMIAELGSCFCLGRLGIDCSRTTKNSTAYLQSWIRTAQDESHILAKTISLSAQACEYVLDGARKEESVEG